MHTIHTPLHFTENLTPISVSIIEALYGCYPVELGKLARCKPEDGARMVARRVDSNPAQAVP